MDNKIKAPKIVIIFSLTLITIIFWAAFEIYRSLTAKPSPLIPTAVLDPVNPTLDATALSRIQTRLHLDESQIRLTTPVPVPESAPDIVVASPSAFPLPTDVPEATVSASPNP